MKIFNSLPSNLKSFNLNFLEWFISFCDTKICFYIKILSNNIITLKILLGFHLGELPLLKELKNIFNYGNITIFKTTCFYGITIKKDIQNIIISNFEYFPLNSIKYFNYQNFKKAFEIYTSRNNFKNDTLVRIQNIKFNKNKVRQLNIFFLLAYITLS